ncbi:MAG: hypothetical protein FWD53_01675 [Phycisphaerales bacterium]|nr:hypothetical protein [Phycisphaerales bacterium]
MRTWKMAATGLVLLAITAGSVAAEQPEQPVVDYGPPSDLEPRLLPPLPKLGPAGSIFIEPTFGYRILRVTDENTMPGNRSFGMKYPGVMFNCDSTKFYVCDFGGGLDIPFSFDPKTLKAQRIGNAVMHARAYFSTTDPDILYGLHPGKYPNSIVKYNFKTQEYEQLLDVKKLVPGMKGNIGTFSISSTDEVAIECNGDGQDRFRTVVWANLKTGKSHVLDAVDKTIDGKPMDEKNFWSGIHDVQILKGGRYVQVCTNPLPEERQAGLPPRSKAVYWFWDVQTHKIHLMKDFDHWAAGYDSFVNKGNAVLTMQTFTEPGVGGSGMAEPVSLLPVRLPGDAHESWNNSRPGKLYPILVETCRAGPNAFSDKPYAPLDQEIFAVATDGSKKVWRFAHNRIRDKNWYHGPNVSQDGRFCLFTSMWEESLGKDANGKPRYDVFLIELVKPAK